MLVIAWAAVGVSASATGEAAAAAAGADPPLTVGLPLVL